MEDLRLQEEHQRDVTVKFGQLENKLKLMIVWLYNWLIGILFVSRYVGLLVEENALEVHLSSSFFM